MGEKASGSSRNPKNNNREKQSDTATLKLFGMEIPLPPWAVSIIAIAAIVAVPVALYVGIRHQQADDKVNKDLQTQTQQLLQTQEGLKQAKDALNTMLGKLKDAQDNYNEVTKHSHEQGEAFHNDAKLSVTYYRSDGCVYVRRSANAATTSEWIKDPSLAPASPPPGALDGGVSSELIPAGKPLLLEPAVYTVSAVPLVPAQQGPQCRGRCLNPHPGNFTSQNGRTQGCWVQVWRRWQDGCTHYQWFNACSASWDSYPNGQPRVYWTCCNH